MSVPEKLPPGMVRAAIDDGVVQVIPEMAARVLRRVRYFGSAYISVGSRDRLEVVETLSAILQGANARGWVVLQLRAGGWSLASISELMTCGGLLVVDGKQITTPWPDSPPSSA